MREKNFGFIFWVVVFCCYCHYPSKGEDDGKSRQTFVIRYKDGEQTIPVTVVLDYKKQTEYVINMNPRTPAKSVTLYDFKQRTIAYKDLTNRECFLGRLTHETLNEETSALQDVKNPVEGKPKVRSLDPRKPALTPTEIRNIAGQKTAVFCRKMNTWLLMPEKVHGISKREADEYEERTYQYHGHRSSQYSHYERETRRRYRNRSQAANTRRRSQRNKSAAENGNGKFLVSEPSLNPQRSSSHSSNSNNFNPGNFNNVPHRSAQNHSLGPQEPPKVYSSVGRNFDGDKGNVNGGSSFPNSIPLGRSHINGNNFVHPNYESRLSSSQIPRPAISASDYFNSNETDKTPLLDPEKISDAPKNTSKYFGVSRPLESIVSESALTSTEKPTTTDTSFVPQGQRVNYPNVHPSLVHLLPLYKPLGQEFDFNRPNTLETNETAQANNHLSRQRNIEREFHPSPTAFEADNQFSHIADRYNTSRNSDIPIKDTTRTTKKFENIKANGSYVRVPQSENDREFHNSAGSNSSASRTYFNNSPYVQRINPHGTSLGRNEHIPLTSNNSINNVGSNAYLNEINFHIPQSEISTTTELPVLTTPEYFVTDRTTSNTVYIPSVHTAFQNSEDFNSFQIFPNYIQNNNFNSLERNLTAPSFYEPNNKFTGGNPERVTQHSILTTEYPRTENKHEIRTNHRSDVPSEDAYGRLTSSNHEASVGRNTYPPVSNKTADEGVPPYRIRYQSALRDFKPDEIVIDIENIPTQTPLPVTSRFQQRLLTTIQPTVEPLRSNVIRSDTDRRSEQTSVTAWRSFLPTTRYPRRRVNDKTRRIAQNGSISLSQRGSLSQNQQHIVKPPSHINQLIGVNHLSSAHHTNGRQFHYPSRPNPSSQIRIPTELNQLHHFSQLNNLPPGVSVHPRHPQAPFADMIHSNRPPTMPVVDDNQSLLKPHRQRHHRKKDRLVNSCCRLRGKSGAFQSCCRNGGPCCSSSRRRMQPPGSPCCSSSKNIGQIIPTSQIQQPVRTRNQILPPIRTEEVRRSDTGSKDRCQKEKMCRTLYESTQQVMVCRSAHVEGC